MQNNLIFPKAILLHTPLPTAVYCTDDLVISFANPAMRNLWNKDEQIIGKKIADIIADFEKDSIHEEILRVMKTGIPFQVNDIKINHSN